MIIANGGEAAMAGSASGFVRPERRWHPDEDAALIAGIRDMLTYGEIAEHLPDRTVAGIKNRVAHFRVRGLLPPAPPPSHTAIREDISAPTSQHTAEATGSLSLLRALLRLGARREGVKGLPGLSAEQFQSLCNQHGVAIL